MTNQEIACATVAELVFEDKRFNTWPADYQYQASDDYQNIILKRYQEDRSDLNKALLENVSPYSDNNYYFRNEAVQDLNSDETDKIIDQIFINSKYIQEIETAGINLKNLKIHFKERACCALDGYQLEVLRIKLWVEAVQNNNSLDIDYSELEEDALFASNRIALQKVAEILPKAIRVFLKQEQHSPKELKLAGSNFLKAVNIEKYEYYQGDLVDENINWEKQRLKKDNLPLTKTGLIEALKKDVDTLDQLRSQELQSFSLSLWIDLNLIGNIPLSKIVQALITIDDSNRKQAIAEIEQSDYFTSSIS